MSKKRTLFLIIFLVPLVLAGCGRQELSGNYTGKIKIMGSNGTDTFKFDDNKVTEITNGGTNNRGTYTIDNNKLLITMDGGNINATLTDDGAAFKVTTADGLTNLAQNTVYHEDTN